MPYSQLFEPDTLRSFLRAANVASDNILMLQRQQGSHRRPKKRLRQAQKYVIAAHATDFAGNEKTQRAADKALPRQFKELF